MDTLNTESERSGQLKLMIVAPGIQNYDYLRELKHMRCFVMNESVSNCISHECEEGFDLHGSPCLPLSAVISSNVCLDDF